MRGDDSSWKIQYSDLSRVEDGIIERDERFGYIELRGSVLLRDAIHVRGLRQIASVDIAVSTTWDLQTGKMAWEIEQGTPAPNYGGVLSTAGGLVFYSESSGAFAAVDAKTGRTLWHFETGQPPKASPMTYTVNGRQYVAIAAGANVLAFALPYQVESDPN